MNMNMTNLRFGFSFLLFFGYLFSTSAYSDRFRAMWRDDPSTTMVIGWDLITGTNPVLYYDLEDHGRNPIAYKLSRRPDRVVGAKGMNNHFARISGLKPNTTYYFVVKDSEGVSERYSFRTAPDQPTQRLSIIAGGDSRNHREARRSANLLVAKLRPHAVLFNGDMTVRDGTQEWKEWMDDWQQTITSDGRLIPVLTARGNHEVENKTLVDLFDLPHPGNFYALDMGGNLLRLYTLNSMIPAGGEQKTWLENDLTTQGASATWRIAQYHHAIRPHTAAKKDKDDLYIHWASLFHQYKVQLVIESDSHVVKWTYPLRPNTGPGSEQGFIRDDATGTVYVGEGCWGAPRRENDDDKPWTRASGSFNQFNWIFVDQDKIEVRTVMTDDAEQVGEVSPNKLFEPPVGISFWSPPGGDVIRIYRKGGGAPVKESTPAPVVEAERPAPAKQPAVSANIAADNDLGGNWNELPRLAPNPSTGRVKIDYELTQPADVSVVLYNGERAEIARLAYDAQPAGPYSRSLDFSRLPQGEYLLLVRVGRNAVKRYLLVKG